MTNIAFNGLGRINRSGTKIVRDTPGWPRAANDIASAVSGPSSVSRGIRSCRLGAALQPIDRT